MLQDIDRPAVPQPPSAAIPAWLRAFRLQPLEAVAKPQALQMVLWSLLMALVFGLAMVNLHSFQVGVYGDDAVYIVQARTLAEKDNPAAILPERLNNNRFPFGFPLLLSALAALFPGNVDALKGISLAATLANTALLFWFWPQLSANRSYWWGLAVAALYALSPLTIEHTGMVMSEPVFTTFSLAAMLIAGRFAQQEQSWLWKTLLGLSLVLVVFTRSVGLILLLAVFAYLLLARGLRVWRELAQVTLLMLALTTLIVALTPVQAADLLPSRYVQYMIQMRAPAVAQALSPFMQFDPPPFTVASASDGGAASNLPKPTSFQLLRYSLRQHLGHDFRQAVLPYGSERGQALGEAIGIPSLMLLVGFITSALIFAGAARLLVEKRLSLFALFAAIYVAALFAWAWEGPRLLYPIQPQILFGFLYGIHWILSAGQLGRAPAQALVNATMAGMALGLVLLSALKSYDIPDSRQHTGDLQARTQWLVENTPPSTIFLSEAAEVDYVTAGRKTIPYPLQPPASPRDLEAYLQAYAVDYILVAPEIAWQEVYTPRFSHLAEHVLPLIEELARQNRLAQVYASADSTVRVYQLQR